MRRAGGWRRSGFYVAMILSGVQSSAGKRVPQPSGTKTRAEFRRSTVMVPVLNPALGAEAVNTRITGNDRARVQTYPGVGRFASAVPITKQGESMRKEWIAALIVALILSLSWNVILATKSDQPVCPTEDSCAIDYSHGRWHITRVIP
jgi:hypothetical protein